MANLTLKSNSADILARVTESISHEEYKRLVTLGESLIEIDSPFFKNFHNSALQKGEIVNIEIWNRAYYVVQAYVVNMLAKKGLKTITFVGKGNELKKRTAYLNALRISLGVKELPKDVEETSFERALIVGCNADLKDIRGYTQYLQDKNGEMFIPVVDKAFERFATLRTHLVGDIKAELGQINTPVFLFNSLKMPTWVPNSRKNLPAAVTMAKNFKDNVLVRPACKITTKEQLRDIYTRFENCQPVDLECFYGRGDYLSEKDAVKISATASKRKGFLPVSEI